MRLEDLEEAGHVDDTRNGDQTQQADGGGGGADEVVGEAGLVCVDGGFELEEGR